MPVVGDALLFGIADEQGGLSATQRFSVTKKTDKKEARNKDGNVISVAFYNKTWDVSIEGMSTAEPGQEVGAVLALSSPPLAPDGTVYCEEVSAEQSNEDFVKFKIKAMAWEGIS